MMATGQPNKMGLECITVVYKVFYGWLKWMANNARWRWASFVTMNEIRESLSYWSVIGLKKWVRLRMFASYLEVIPAHAIPAASSLTHLSRKGNKSGLNEWTIGDSVPLSAGLTRVSLKRTLTTEDFVYVTSWLLAALLFTFNGSGHTFF